MHMATLALPPEHMRPMTDLPRSTAEWHHALINFGDGTPESAACVNMPSRTPHTSSCERTAGTKSRKKQICHKATESAFLTITLVHRHSNRPHATQFKALRRQQQELPNQLTGSVDTTDDRRFQSFRHNATTDRQHPSLDKPLGRLRAASDQRSEDIANSVQRHTCDVSCSATVLVPCCRILIGLSTLSDIKSYETGLVMS